MGPEVREFYSVFDNHFELPDDDEITKAFRYCLVDLNPEELGPITDPRLDPRTWSELEM